MGINKHNVNEKGKPVFNSFFTNLQSILVSQVILLETTSLALTVTMIRLAFFIILTSIEGIARTKVDMFQLHTLL
jgi:hypothetical protein